MRILAIGGETSEASPLVESFDPSANRWDWGTPMKARRVAAAATAVSRAVYVSGGRNADEQTLDSFEVWDQETDAWSIAPDLPTFRHDHALSTWGDHVYAIGGSHRGRLATVDRYDPVRVRWEAAPSLPVEMGPVRAHVEDGQLTAIGVVEVTAGGTTYEVCALDRTGARWHSLARFETPRRWAAIAMRGTIIYVIGGHRDGKPSADVVLHDIATGASSAGAPVPTARINATAVAVGDTIYVIGGSFDALARTGAVERLDANVGTWARLAPLTHPRSSVCAVVLPA